MRSETVSSLACTSAAFAKLSAEMLGAGSALRFRARSASKSPLRTSGDVVLFRPAGRRAVRVGEVVLCGITPGRVVAHRVMRKEVGREGSWFTVQG